MRGEHHKVARAYVLYREERAEARRSRRPRPAAVGADAARHAADGTPAPARLGAPRAVVGEAVAGLDDVVRRAGARRDPPQSLRRHLRRRTGARADHGRAHAGRDGAELLLRQRAAAARHAAQRGRLAPGRQPPAAPARPRWPRATPTTSAPTSRTPSTLELLDPELRASTSTKARRARSEAGARSATSSSSACRRSTTATSCTSAASASSCRRRSSCASRWGWRCARSTARRARSSSTICCRRSTSWPRRRRCSTPAHCGRSSRPAS